MKPPKFLLTISVIAFLTCITNVNAQTVFRSDYVSFPVPQQYDGPISYLDDNSMVSILNIIKVKHDKTLLKSFPNSVSTVTIYQVTNEINLNVLRVQASEKNQTYQVIYDFSQSQTVTWSESDTVIHRSALVGIGVRMVAKIKTLKAGINLTTPINLAVNYEKINGTLEVRVTGVTSPKIIELIPTTTDLSPSSISVALQAVASIKSHIYDTDVTITPQYLAYNIDTTIIVKPKPIMK
jgi:hypothetical protein